MNTIYVFDMDGTLTPPRKPMEEQFAKLLLPWLETNRAYLATGSDFKKVQEQLPKNIIYAFTGVFCSMGNILWQKGKTIYKNDYEPEAEMVDALEKQRNNTKYPGTLYPNYIEVRTGMINFSVLGRDCPYEAREEYSAWDSKNHEREAIQKELSARFEEYDITLGGAISLDIVKKGYGKGQIAIKLREIELEGQITFYGDKTFEGGNDYDLACALRQYEGTVVVQVNSPDDLLGHLGIR